MLSMKRHGFPFTRSGEPCLSVYALFLCAMFAFDIVPIFDPTCGIIDDIFPNLLIIFLVSDHMLVIGFLPKSRSSPHRRPSFHLPNNGNKRRGGNLPPVIIRIDTENQVDMIRHDDIIINENRWIDSRNAFYSGINDFSISGEMQFWRAADSRPYGDVRQNAPPVSCAYGDEIGAGGGVIIIRQAELFSLGQIHGTTPFSA